MATAESVKAKLQGLIDTANETTGNTNTDLTTAIRALVEGYGQGGDSGELEALLERTITAISNNNVTSIGDYAFYYYNTLASVNFPSVTNIGTFAFSYCNTLASVNFPSVTSIGNYAFSNCAALASVNFPSITSIGNYVFQKCTTLTSLILSNASRVCTLQSISAFESTPFRDGTGGTVYVPSALIENYQTATNWSKLYAAGTCNFVAIEGSEYE